MVVILIAGPEGRLRCVKQHYPPSRMPQRALARSSHNRRRESSLKRLLSMVPSLSGAL